MDVLTVLMLGAALWGIRVLYKKLCKIGGRMNELLAAITRLQASAVAINAKVDSLAANQADPTALANATAALNAVSDSLDAKVAQ